MSSPRILTTLCDKCVFHVEDMCFLGKTLINGNSVGGFCRHKRMSKNQYKDINSFKREQDDLDKKMDVVIYYDGDKESLYKTVNYIFKDDSPVFVNKVVVLSFERFTKDHADIANYFNGNKNVKKWSIVEDKKQYDDANLAIDNYIFQNAYKTTDNANWFLTIKNGDIVCIECIYTRFFGLILNATSDENPFCLAYPSDPTNYRALFYVPAFIQLDGNRERHWLEKCRTFGNHDSCVKTLLDTSIVFNQEVN